jgi:DnaJ-class molecular chaperone
VVRDTGDVYPGGARQRPYGADAVWEDSLPYARRHSAGEAFRLRGKGIQILNRSGKGDQYVRVQVEIPRNLSESQKSLLRQFDETASDGRNYEKRRTFFDKLKNAFK